MVNKEYYQEYTAYAKDVVQVDFLAYALSKHKETKV